MSPASEKTIPEVDKLSRQRTFLFVGAALFVFGLDQISKSLIGRHFNLHQSQTVIPGLFNITYVTNTGVAFGLFSGQYTSLKQLIFLAVGLLAAGIIVYFFHQLESRAAGTALALGMVLGGAAGNSVDRIRLAGVIDFLDFYIGSHHWPAFNVADAAITCGIFYLMISLYKHKE